MTDIHIPFGKGQSEAVDPKLMPQGLLSRAENVRYRRDGRLGLRYGYSHLTGAPAGSFACAEHTDGTVICLVPRTSVIAPPTVVGLLPDGSITPYPPSPVTLGDIGYVKRQGIGGPMVGLAIGSDCSAGPGGDPYNPRMWYASCDGGGPVPTVTAFCVELSSGEVLFSTTISNAVGPKLIAYSDGTLACFYADTSGHLVKMLAINTTTYALVSHTLVSCTLTSWFDACLGPTGYALVVYNSGGYMRISTVTSAGTVATVFSQPDITAAGPSSISYIAGTGAGLVWIDAPSGTSSVYYRTWQADWTPLVAATQVDSGGWYSGFPIAGPIGSAHVFLWNVVFAGGGSLAPHFRVMSSEVVCVYDVYDLVAISRPFSVDGGTYVLAADCAQGTGVGGCAAGAGATGYMVDLNSTSVTPSRVAAKLCEGLVYHLFQITANQVNDSRLRVQTFYGNAAYTISYACTMVPTYDGLHYGASAVQIVTGSGARARSIAQLNGQTFVAGPIVHTYDGHILAESGLGPGPRYVAVAETGVGTVDVGAHSWIVVWEWTDAGGRVQRSPPSAPVSHTVASSAKTIAVTYEVPAFVSALGAYATVYRTLAGGLTYYRLASVYSSGAATITTQQASFAVYTDNLADGAIATGPTIYTQGDRGAISGLLPNDPPPSCRYLWSGANRLLAGGLDASCDVQWSKLAYPGEGVTWSIDPGYRATVDGVVTGVAYQDGAWYIFTEDALWQVFGDGPDDNGAGGSFTAPTKLPSPVGCVSHASIIATGEGLLFQSMRGIELLPRGGVSPQWIGQPVRDTLALYPTITASCLISTESCVYWACVAADGATGALVVYDLRNGEWFIDTFRARAVGMLCRRNDALLLDGSIAQTPAAYVDDDTGSASGRVYGTIITGDIRPFGVSGRGRVRMFHVLAEYRAGTPSLSCYLSYDSGRTWTDSKVWSLVAGLVVATGTAPPTADVTGTPSPTYSIPITVVRIDITTAGDLGVGKYRWSVNDGEDWAGTNVTLSSSHALGTTGLTAMFPSGAYSTDNSYTKSYPDCVSAGQAVSREIGPSRVRGTAYRIKILVSDAARTEGLIINALSLEAYQIEGVRRLASAQRG